VSTNDVTTTPAAFPVAESFAQIRAADLRPETIVPVPEWGLSVVVRELDVATMLKIGNSSLDSKGKTDVQQNLMLTFAAGVVKPPVGPGDAERLHELSSNAFMRVVKAIQGKKNDDSKT
jgi:hypothetical protein